MDAPSRAFPKKEMRQKILFDRPSSQSTDDEDEEASPEEVLSMALHLGINPLDPEDEPLLWIAAEAYDAPLPDNWTEHFDWQGKVYFFCKETDTVSRDHPLDEFYRQLYREYRSQSKSHQAATVRGDMQEEEVRAAAAASVYKVGGVTPHNPIPRGLEAASSGGTVAVKQQLQQQQHHQYDSPAKDDFSALVIKSGETVLPGPLANSAAEVLSCPNGDGDELALVVAPQRADFEAAGSAAIVALRERLERAETAAAEARTKALEERFEAEKSVLRDQISRAEERATAAERSAAEEREKAQAMVMKALEAATSIGSGENKRVGDMHEMLLAKARELEEARARARAAEEAATAAKARELALEDRVRSRDADLEAERARVRKAETDMGVKAVEMERTKAQLEVETAAAAKQHQQQQQQQQLLLPPDPPAVIAVTVAASKAAEDAEEQTRALHRQVSNLEQDLEDERNRARRERSSQEDEIKSLKNKTRLSGKFLKSMEGIQLRAADLKKQQRAVEEEMRQLQLYTFTKMEHCGATVSKIGAELEQVINERNHLKSAVAECDLRIGPLIREKRRLFNELLTAKGNIRVFCRVRPISERELTEGAQVAVAYPPDDGAHRLIRLVGRCISRLYECTCPHILF